MSKRPRKGLFIDTYYENQLLVFLSQDLILRTRNDVLEMYWRHSNASAELKNIGLNGHSPESFEGISIHKQTKEWSSICKIIESVTTQKLHSNFEKIYDQTKALSECGIKAVANMKISRSSFTMKLKINEAIARVNVNYDDIHFLPCDDELEKLEVDITPQNCKYTLGEFEVLSIQNYRRGYKEFLNLVSKELGISVSPTYSAKTNIHGFASDNDCASTKSNELYHIRDAPLEYLSRFRPRCYDTIAAKRLAHIRATDQPLNFQEGDKINDGDEGP